MYCFLVRANCNYQNIDLCVTLSIIGDCWVATVSMTSYYARLLLSMYQGGGTAHGLTQNSSFNSYHGLFLPLTPIVNTGVISINYHAD